MLRPRCDRVFLRKDYAGLDRVVAGVGFKA